MKKEKGKLAVDDICNSTAVISSDACYASADKTLDYHCVCARRLVPPPLARLWLHHTCVGGFSFELAKTRHTCATCFLCCLPPTIALPFLPFAL